MSTQRGEEVKYTCFHDCLGLEGCPGHVLRVDYFHTADLWNVYIDGEMRYIFDPEEARAMYKALTDFDK